MKKRYIVSINNASNDQEKAFVQYIKAKNFGWWHWINNTWLIIDYDGKSSAAEIRTDAKDIFVGEHTLIIEITGDSDTWAGYGSNKDGTSMFEWLKKNW